MHHEISCEVSARGQMMRGFLHRPESCSAARRFPAVLFLHGLGGNHIGPHRFLVEAEKLRGRILILHGAGDDMVPFDEAWEYSRAFAACDPDIKILPDADHEFSRVEWTQEVIETTADWLGKNL